MHTIIITKMCHSQKRRVLFIFLVLGLESDHHSVSYFSTIMITSARVPRRGRRRGRRNNSPGSVSKEWRSGEDLSLHSVSTTSSDSMPMSAISFEASPYLFFSEMESMINPGDSPSQVATYNFTELIADRVQRRLLDKHIKAGRIVSAFSAVEVADNSDLLHGSEDQQRRATRSTLSFCKIPIGVGCDNGNSNTHNAQVSSRK